MVHTSSLVLGHSSGHTDNIARTKAALGNKVRVIQSVPRLSHAGTARSRDGSRISMEFCNVSR